MSTLSKQALAAYGSGGYLSFEQFVAMLSNKPWIRLVCGLSSSLMGLAGALFGSIHAFATVRLAAAVALCVTQTDPNCSLCLSHQPACYAIPKAY